MERLALRKSVHCCTSNLPKLTMKFFLIAAFLAAASAASLPYPQPAPKYSKDAEVTVVSQSDVRNPDGSSQWSYALSDGTTREESQAQRQIGKEIGNTNRGSSYWIAPDGQRFTLTWVADENGFQPKGDHLPTPVPIPEEIAAVWATVRTPANPAPAAYPAPARY